MGNCVPQLWWKHLTDRVSLRGKRKREKSDVCPENFFGSSSSFLFAGDVLRGRVLEHPVQRLHRGAPHLRAAGGQEARLREQVGHQSHLLFFFRRGEGGEIKILPNQPPTVVCKMEAQSEHVHVAYTFLHPNPFLGLSQNQQLELILGHT